MIYVTDLEVRTRQYNTVQLYRVAHHLSDYTLSKLLRTVLQRCPSGNPILPDLQLLKQDRADRLNIQIEAYKT